MSEPRRASSDERFRAASLIATRVRDLGAELFGTRRHWPKRIVRSGPNTLQPYRENPPDRTMVRGLRGAVAG